MAILINVHSSKLRMWSNNAQPNTTKLTVKDQAVAIIDSTKLLGTILTDDLKFQYFYLLLYYTFWRKYYYWAMWFIL